MYHTCTLYIMILKNYVCSFSWYFGTRSREETNEILNPTESGVFLVRDSQSIKGDFVLCVK